MFCTASITVTFDSTYNSLPTVTRTDYTFEGWYTSASGGNKIESSTKVTITSNQTLYAHWIINNQAPNKPTVSQNTKTTSSITLNITGTDPDNDNLTYDVYMNNTKIGTTSQVASGASTTFTTESNLSNYTSYKFYAIAKDPKDEKTQGDEVSIRTYCSGTTNSCIRTRCTDGGVCGSCDGEGKFDCTWRRD